MFQVHLTQSAENDLLEAWLVVAEENITAADRMLDSKEREAAILSRQPMMGRARPELADDVRSWPTSTPYLLFYLAQEHGITVLRALHHSRDIHRAWF